MKFAFLMDPIDSIKFVSDSTWQLMLEAVTRGEVYYFTPLNLFWRNNELLAQIQKVTISNNEYYLSGIKTVSLEEMDVIFIRQDPPYDMNYLTTTYLLEKLSPKVLLLNNPKAIRDFPEKISILDYPNLIPPTLITSCINEAKSFAKKYDKVILKPLYSFAGNDIFCSSYNSDDLLNIANKLLESHKAPFIVQEFIPKVKLGDKRVILVDGKPIGVFIRKPEDGSIKSNLACGGTAYPTELNARDIQICQEIAPKLVKNGLFLVGIDIIDIFLTEINVTSPTGLVLIKEFKKEPITNLIFSLIEDKVSTKNLK
jgi:glutathione synthase